jgi:hypothetical protein
MVIVILLLFLLNQDGMSCLFFSTLEIADFIEKARAQDLLAQLRGNEQPLQPLQVSDFLL